MGTISIRCRVEERPQQGCPCEGLPAKADRQVRSIRSHTHPDTSVLKPLSGLWAN